MTDKLSVFISDITSIPGAIKDFYFHRNYTTGELEMNIEFDESVLEMLEKEYNRELIRESDRSAFWE